MAKKPLHPIKAASAVSQCLIRAAEVMICQGRTPGEAAEFVEAAARVLELPPEWVRLTAAIVRGIKGWEEEATDDRAVEPVAGADQAAADGRSG